MSHPSSNRSDYDVSTASKLLETRSRAHPSGTVSSPQPIQPVDSPSVYRRSAPNSLQSVTMSFETILTDLPVLAISADTACRHYSEHAITAHYPPTDHRRSGKITRNSADSAAHNISCRPPEFSPDTEPAESTNLSRQKLPLNDSQARLMEWHQTGTRYITRCGSPHGGVVNHIAAGVVPGVPIVVIRVHWVVVCVVDTRLAAAAATAAAATATAAGGAGRDPGCLTTVTRGRRTATAIQVIAQPLAAACRRTTRIIAAGWLAQSGEFPGNRV